MIPPFLMLSEALRAAQTGSLRAGWVFAHPARIDRRRAAQRGSERPMVERVWPRLSGALRMPSFRPAQANSRTNSKTGNTGPLRGSQRHSERRAEPQPAWRPTERGGAGATDPSGAEALRSGSERVRQRLSGGPQSGRSCPRFWTVYGPVIHSRQLDASNRSS